MSFAWQIPFSLINLCSPIKGIIMKVTFFGVQPYDKLSFNTMNESFGFDIEYHSSQLNAKTVSLAQGSDAICIFVNDVADEETIKRLNDAGVKLIALRCAGFNNVDLNAAKKYDIPVVRVPAYSPHVCCWQEAVHYGQKITRQQCSASSPTASQ